MGIDKVMKHRAIFLDRDGVLNKAVYIDGKSYPPADADSLELAPGAVQAVMQLKEAGYLCICVTNQPDIARKTRTLENVNEMNEKVRSALALDDLYMCPHDNQDNCLCRKPKPGMLLTANAKWNIDLINSWMIGDRSTDIAAGKTAGCRTILITTMANLEFGQDFQCRDISKVADIVITRKWV